MNARITGRQFECDVLGKRMRILNQHSTEWSHRYNHPVDPDDNLHTAGCGIFSLCHAVEWMTGLRLKPEALADFSMANGGRGDDGTDRPALLDALERLGEARLLGFSYSGDGLRNDHDALFSLLWARKGTALANLRSGHIVCLLAARALEDERQVLVIDSNPNLKSQFAAIREVIAGSEITYLTVNPFGVTTGACIQAAAFWVPLNLARDFNLLQAL